jgi:hypothetical protein
MKWLEKALRDLPSQYTGDVDEVISETEKVVGTLSAETMRLRGLHLWYRDQACELVAKHTKEAGKAHNHSGAQCHSVDMQLSQLTRQSEAASQLFWVEVEHELGPSVTTDLTLRKGGVVVELVQDDMSTIVSALIAASMLSAAMDRVDRPSPAVES